MECNDLEKGYSRVPKRGVNRLYSFAFSRDGRFILGTVIRDRYGNELGQLHVKSSLDFADADQYGIEHLAFSADGSLVIRTYHDTITTWKTRTFEHEMQWSDEARITSIADAPDGTIVTGHTDGTAHRWDPMNRRELTRYVGPSPVISAAFSHDRHDLFTASEDGKGYLWDMSTGRVIRDFDAKSKMFDIIFSPDDARVLAQGNDLARLWDKASGKLLRAFDSCPS